MLPFWKKNTNKKSSSSKEVSSEKKVIPLSFSESQTERYEKDLEDFQEHLEISKSEKSLESEQSRMKLIEISQQESNLLYVKFPSKEKWSEFEKRLLFTFASLQIKKENKLAQLINNVSLSLHFLIYKLQGLAITGALILFILFSVSILGNVNNTIDTYYQYMKSQNKITSEMMPPDGVYLFPKGKK